jgi:hypothetical protein
VRVGNRRVPRTPSSQPSGPHSRGPPRKTAGQPARPTRGSPETRCPRPAPGKRTCPSFSPGFPGMRSPATVSGTCGTLWWEEPYLGLLVWPTSRAMRLPALPAAKSAHPAHSSLGLSVLRPRNLWSGGNRGKNGKGIRQLRFAPAVQAIHPQNTTGKKGYFGRFCDLPASLPLEWPVGTV